ncbi:MAG TPA: phenylacetate--CoA ligase [Roseiflexaceae bacterium]|jgi:phenylacetate-CoA ligase
MRNAVKPYIWDQAEALSRPEMEQLQVVRLRAALSRVSEAVPFYREKLAAAGVTADSIRTLDDLARVPFTTKQDLRDHYPFGLFAAPMRQIVRFHASSGTTGKLTVVGYTRNDIALWADVIARALAAAGVTDEDIVHNAYGYGLFTGGLGFHYGAEHLGAKVIPVSGGNTRRQVQIMRDFGSTVLCCTPSYALLIAETAAEEGIDPASLALKVGLFGAEPWSERMRQEIESRLGLLALDHYGLSEVIGPGVASECAYKQGLHICEDHFIPEIVAPDSGERLPDGEIGELVFTCVTKEALPLLRYRTRDRTRLIREPCACGRTTARMQKVLGRTDDMIIVRGVNVFPSQIETVLLEFGEVEPHYQIVVDRGRDFLDELDVLVEASAEVFQSQERLSQLEQRLVYSMQSALGIVCKVRLVEPKQIQRSEGKAVRVVDKRQMA